MFVLLLWAEDWPHLYQVCLKMIEFKVSGVGIWTYYVDYGDPNCSKVSSFYASYKHYLFFENFSLLEFHF